MFPETAHSPRVRAALHRKQWAAWLPVLPLDLQVELLRRKMDPALPSAVDLGAVRWDQQAALDAAPHPDAAYLASPLSDRFPDGTVPRPLPGAAPALYPRTTWAETRHDLVRATQNIAAQFMVQGDWARLGRWMTDSGQRATTPVESLVYASVAEDSPGLVAAPLKKPLPFWALGLYAGATDPGFWAVMARAGGPPLLTSAPQATPSLQALAAVVDAPLAAIRSIAAFEGVEARITRTAALWRARALRAELQEAPSPRKGLRL